MKNILWSVLCCSILTAGCAANFSSSAIPQNNDTKVCRTDSDCVAIPKGCCQCDGLQAVNKWHAEKMKMDLQASCKDTMCTMQYCFNEIRPKCESNKCTAVPQQYPEQYNTQPLYQKDLANN